MICFEGSPNQRDGKKERRREKPRQENEPERANHEKFSVAVIPHGNQSGKKTKEQEIKKEETSKMGGAITAASRVPRECGEEERDLEANFRIHMKEFGQEQPKRAENMW